jgi:hypothetical protein
LKAKYGNNKHAIFGTLNKIGAMKGPNETALGRKMEEKHERDKKSLGRRHITNSVRTVGVARKRP